jgi:hypothetical protein
LTTRHRQASSGAGDDDDLAVEPHILGFDQLMRTPRLAYVMAKPTIAGGP